MSHDIVEVKCRREGADWFEGRATFLKEEVASLKEGRTSETGISYTTIVLKNGTKFEAQAKYDDLRAIIFGVTPSWNADTALGLKSIR